MENWNAIIGKHEQESLVGKFGGNTKSNRGEISRFCKEQKLFATNTWFKNHKRRKYTWTAAGERPYKTTQQLVTKQTISQSMKDIAIPLIAPIAYHVQI